MSALIGGLFLAASIIGVIYAIDAVLVNERSRAGVRVAGASVALILVVFGTLLLATDRDNATIAGFALLSAGSTLGLLMLPPVRAVVARLLPLNAAAPRDWVGLVALLWLVIVRLALFYRGEEEISQVQVAEAMIQALVLVGVALALIGIGTRRDVAQAVRRLGLRSLSYGQSAFAAVVVIPFAVVGALSVMAVEYMQPGTVERLEETVTSITGGETSLQYGLMLGITAAVGEETLFRGALQPKYGLVFTSLVFALLHVQYDLLLIVASLFPVGLILGLERKYLGTVAAIVTHALYNTLVVVAGS